MKRTLKVGLTGGIGSGKSLALAVFARLGAATASSDDIARAQAAPRGAARKKILALFKTADRAAIAARVFRDPAARRRLENATHPLVLREIRRQARRAKGVFVADVPLLFEAGLEREFDVTLAIRAPERARLSRLAGRGLAAADARRRMAAQLTDDQRAAKADVVIGNDGTKKDFLRKIASYHRALQLLQRGAVA